MNVILAVSAVVLLVVMQPRPTEGGSYQWKDEQGVRHFSDQPPPSEKQLPVEPLVTPEKKISSTTEPVPFPSPPETAVKDPVVPDAPIKAAHEMIFGRWKPHSPQLRKEISAQMKTDSGKKDKNGLAGAIGDAMATGIVAGMMESMRIEFTRDTVTTEVMGEKQTTNYSVVKIENNVIVLKAEKKIKNAVIHVLDDARITFQEDGKGDPMTMVRDDGKPK